jgi:hypothetical protein
VYDGWARHVSSCLFAGDSHRAANRSVWVSCVRVETVALCLSSTHVVCVTSSTAPSFQGEEALVRWLYFVMCVECYHQCPLLIIDHLFLFATFQPAKSLATILLTDQTYCE